MTELVKVERRDAIAVVRIDRPKVNALNSEVVAGLEEACASIEGDRSVRAVVVYGGERVFSAGADLEEMAEGSPQDVRRRVGGLQKLCDRIEALPVVTVAAINGYALGGGCEIALACDFRVASQRARIGQPEVAVGLIPGAGGTQRLPRLVGPARAKWMIFTGELVDAPTAQGWGLVDGIDGGDDALGLAMEQAGGFASGATLSLAAAKKAINHSVRPDGYELELDEFVNLFSTEDTRHGLESFKEHGPGKATFKGR